MSLNKPNPGPNGSKSAATQAKMDQMRRDPGGWTWALQQLGARVVSVDKAPLAPGVALLPRVEHRLQSAWALEPGELGAIDWLFSDMACYPERLLRLVREWMAAGNESGWQAWSRDFHAAHFSVELCSAGPDQPTA